MSSSDSSARRFLRLLAGGLVAFATLALALTWAIDPLAALYPYGGGRLCDVGIKTSTARKSKFVAAVARQPIEIFVGSSRVLVGFTRADAERLAGRPAFNLGFHNASLQDTDRTVRAVAGRAPVRRAWLALEFGNFLSSPTEERPLRLPSGLPMPWLAWREGLLSPLALRVAAGAAIRPGWCRSPPIDAHGFLNAGQRNWRERAGFREIARLDEMWDTPDRQHERRFDEGIRRLRDLLRWWRVRRIEPVLFLSPMSDSYWRKIHGAGLAGTYARWRDAVRSLARDEGAVLVEADTDAFLAAVPMRCRPGSTRDECYFYDTIHFRPPVGAAIIAAGAEASRTGRHLDAPSRTP